MTEIQSPHAYGHLTRKPLIFLGGSIEMGAATEWQQEVVAALAGHDVVLLNPRRRDWNSSWAQSIDNAQFREQVEWELEALEDSDIIVFYFDPNTKAPVTLMELGLHAAISPESVIVCCPEGFWRKGNVDIVCARYGVEQAEDLPALIARLQEKLSS